MESADTQDDDTPSSEATTSALSPEEIYAFFKNMPLPDLLKLADMAMARMARCASRIEATRAVVSLAPFFLDCTFPRLPEPLKDRMREQLDWAEQRFGSLASALGLDRDDDSDESSSEEATPQLPPRAVIDALLADITQPSALLDDRAAASEFARRACALTEEAFTSLPTDQQQALLDTIAKVEARHGPIDELAATTADTAA